MTKNFKGGYKIVSLYGNDLTSADPFTIDGLYASLENSYKKPILVTEIVIDGEKEQDAYAVVKKNDSGYSIEVYGYALTVTDEDSVTSEALPEITSIGSGLDLTDGELSASGGGTTLYQHNITVDGTNGSYTYHVAFTLITNSSDSLNTATKIYDIIGNNYIQASGYASDNSKHTIVKTFNITPNIVTANGIDITAYTEEVIQTTRTFTIVDTVLTI